VSTANATATQRKKRAEELLSLWREYKRAPDPRLRDRIILTLAPMVKFIVYRKVREMPAQAEAEDFISVGLEALIQSIDRYDPEKGATLEQYAWTRIHGAVLDEMRRQDWAPRSVRRWERDIEKASRSSTPCTAAGPTATSWPRPSAARWPSCASAATRSRSPTSRRSTRWCSPTTTPPSSAATRWPPRTSAWTPSTPRRPPRPRTSSAMRFSDLPEREREIAILLYVKNLTLSEIGEVLGVSESRVCQIHGQTKKKLRVALQDDAALFHLVA
jgi:RNA polymerase sigma factor for flagellar operon FliA